MATLFKVFHKPIFGFKGSYVVTRLGAERRVSFDNGEEGSIAEDCFFAMLAMDTMNDGDDNSKTTTRHGCQIAIARFLDCNCLALWA